MSVSIFRASSAGEVWLNHPSVWTDTPVVSSSRMSGRAARIACETQVIAVA